MARTHEERLKVRREQRYARRLKAGLTPCLTPEEISERASGCPRNELAGRIAAAMKAKARYFGVIPESALDELFPPR